jgi:hypothetical protein
VGKSTCQARLTTVQLSKPILKKKKKPEVGLQSQHPDAQMGNGDRILASLENSIAETRVSVPLTSTLRMPTTIHIIHTNTQ